jgi:predicted RNA-binding protein YlxR (DUF448 family)
VKKAAKEREKVAVIITRRRMKTISNPGVISGKPKPQRTCIACRKIKSKREMVRLVRTPAGEIEIDLKGKKEGRGAYLCREWACWEKAIKGNQLKYALKGEITQNDLERLGKAGREILKELASG